MKCDVNSHESIVSDRDLLAKESIVEAEEHGKFEHSLLHTHDLLAFLCLGKLYISDYNLNILRPFVLSPQRDLMYNVGGAINTLTQTGTACALVLLVNVTRPSLQYGKG